MSSTARTIIRSAPRATTQIRTFTVSAAQQKTPTEAVKDTLKKVDRTVSDTLVKGIDVGKAASQTVKTKTSEATSETSGTASELAGEAKGKAAEMKGTAKGKASELGGDLKGKVNEIEGTAKGSAKANGL